MNNKKESRGKYLAKNTAIFAIGSIATRLISFLLVPFYTNILTQSEYGVADLVHIISVVLAPILVLNVYESVLRFSLDKDADYDKIMSIGLTILAGGTLVGLLIIPISSLFSVTSDYTVYVFFYTISFSACLLFLSYLRGKEKLVLYSVGNILHTLTIAISNIIFLAVLQKGIEGFFTAHILSNFITVLYAFVVGDVINVIKNYNFDAKLAKAMVKYSVVLIPNTFMWWITNSSDHIMVTSMISVAANGVYAVSYKLPSVVNTLSGVFNQAWNYSAIRENESKDREAYSNRIYNGVVAASVISGVGLIAIMKLFLKVYVGRDYYEAWKYTPQLVTGFVFLTLATFLGTSYSVNKDSKGYLYSGTLGAIANIILNFSLIPTFGIAGAALATCISYITVFVYRCFDTRKYVRIKVLQKQHIVSYVVMFAVTVIMFWDSLYGQIILFLGFVLELFIFRDVWSPLAMAFSESIKHLIR